MHGFRVEREYVGGRVHESAFPIVTQVILILGPEGCILKTVLVGSLDQDSWLPLGSCTYHSAWSLVESPGKRCFLTQGGDLRVHASRIEANLGLISVSLLVSLCGAAQVKVWFQNRRMKWRHSKEAQAQKDKDKEAGEKPSGGGPAADGEQDERSPSRSEGEAESESSDSESLDMAPSDTERTEGAERSLHQTTVIKAPVTGALISTSSAGSGGSSGGGGSSFSFSSASSLSSSNTSAGCASSLGGGGGASELLPVPQPTASSAPKSPEPRKGALGGV